MQIRNATAEDVPAITEIYNWAIENTNANVYWETFSADNRRGWFDSVTAEGYPVLVACDSDGAVLGWGAYSQYRPREGFFCTVEHDVYISPDHHRKGAGKALVEKLIELARADDKIHSMMATINATNEASIVLHENLGFKLVGTAQEVARKFDTWQDISTYQLILD